MYGVQIQAYNVFASLLRAESFDIDTTDLNNV